MISISDYDKCELTFRCQRRHTLLNRNYFLFVLEDRLVISQNQKDKKPKYIIKLSFETIIDWEVKDYQLTAFIISWKNKFKLFHALTEDLLKLKKTLGCRVIYKGASEFYLPLKCLGKGASSQVHLVEGLLDHQLYASKCIDLNFLKQEQTGLKAFQNEIEITSHLNHLNVIKILEVYQGNDTYYLIMEYLEGRSLGDILRNCRGVKLPECEIQIIMKQLFESVKYIHGMNVMHRDIKPDNIMFKHKYQLNSLKLVDFGLSSKIKQDKLEYPKCGTPGYVAPEVINFVKQNYNEKCDLFSIGVIMYKMYTLQNVFQANNYEDLLTLNKKCIINLSSLQFHLVPPMAQDLIEKLLLANPSQRISASEALEHSYFTSVPMFAPKSELKKEFQQQSANCNSKKVKCLTQFYQKPEVENQSFHFQDDFHINVSEHQSEIESARSIPSLVCQGGKVKFKNLDNFQNEFKEKQQNIFKMQLDDIQLK